MYRVCTRGVQDVPPLLDRCRRVSALVGLKQFADLAREETGALTGANIDFAPATDTIRDANELLARCHYEAILSILVSLLVLGIAVDCSLEKRHLLPGSRVGRALVFFLPELLPEAEGCHGGRHSSRSPPGVAAAALASHKSVKHSRCRQIGV